jgi:hypothetical protein
VPGINPADPLDPGVRALVTGVSAPPVFAPLLGLSWLVLPLFAGLNWFVLPLLAGLNWFVFPLLAGLIWLVFPLFAGFN